MTTKEVMRMALEALNDIEATTDLKRLFRDSDGLRFDKIVDDATYALAAELAKPEPEPEPIAWIRPSEEGYDSAFWDNSTVVECTGNKWEGWFPLYRKEDL